MNIKLSKLLRPRWLLVTMLSLGLLLLTACGGGGEDTGRAPGAQFAGTVKVAIVTDMSGQLVRPLDLSKVLGMEKAVNDINAAGGVEVRGQRYRMELLKLDSRSEAVTAVAAAQQAVQEGAIAVAVETCPFAQQVYAQVRVAGTAIAWTNCPPVMNLLDKDTPQYEGIEKNPLLFMPIDFAQPIVIGWIKQAKKLHPEIQRVAYILDDGPLGKALGPMVRQGAREIGAEFVGGVEFPVGTTDFSAYVTNVKALRPDFVYTSLAPGGGVELQVQAAKLDVAPYIMVPGMRPIDVEKMGDLGRMTVILVDWRLPYHKGFAPPQYAEEVAKFGDLPGGFPVQIGFAVAEYDMLKLLVKAIEKAGTATDAKAIAQALVGQSVDSLLGGKVTVQPEHHTLGSMGNIEATRDKFTVYTYEHARADTPVSRHELRR